jgi:hypothetical protein
MRATDWTPHRIHHVAGAFRDARARVAAGGSPGRGDALGVGVDPSTHRRFFPLKNVTDGLCCES